MSVGQGEGALDLQVAESGAGQPIPAEAAATAAPTADVGAPAEPSGLGEEEPPADTPEPAPPPEKKDDPAVPVLLLMIMTAAMIAVVAVGEFALRSGLVRFAVLGVSLLLYAIGVSFVLYKLGGAPERWLHEFRRRTHPMPGQETLSHSLESGDQWKRAAFIADLRSLVGESLALSKRWSPGDLDRAMVGAAEELAAKPWTRQFLVNTSDVGHATAVYSIYGPEGLMDLVEGTVAESRTAQ